MSKRKNNEKDDLDSLPSRLIKSSPKKKTGTKQINGKTETPSSILFSELSNFISVVYSNNMSKESVDDGLFEFQRSLVSRLSKLATNGTYTDIFGESFDEFFDIVVRTINMAGKMRKLLIENDIELPDDFND